MSAPKPKRAGLWALRGMLVLGCVLRAGAAESPAPAPNPIVVVVVENKVDLLRGGNRRPAKREETLAPGDRLITGENSRATLQWYDRTLVQISELTSIEIPPAPRARRESGLRLLKGLLYFFHRDKPGNYEVQTPFGWATILGTEFTLRVDDTQATLDLIDGAAVLSNDLGQVELARNEQGRAQAHEPPVKSPRLEAVNQLIQWFLYYPAVLDPDELPLTTDERRRLADSLAAYRSGNLVGALARFPEDAGLMSPAVNVYHAALLLAVGQVERSGGPRLRVAPASADPHVAALAGALRTLVGAVTSEPGASAPRSAAPAALPMTTTARAAAETSVPPGFVAPAGASGKPRLASVCMAESYAQQSRGTLDDALRLAREATRVSPNFGYAWARVAELEFSHGNVGEAMASQARAAQLSPENAEAVALQGFLLCAEGKVRRALACFERALELDAGLANAWLGRGLCRFRLGDREAGRRDLQTAAALEPQRSVLRSYLAKAFLAEHDRARADQELRLARELDPRDPTPWFYSALMRQEENRSNEAVADLEESQRLNDNRRVYRSEFLLDQDRAVRSASLAAIYRDAAMPDVSLREAARAVTEDYSSYSAHLFLANSYELRRDPTRFNLRYETPWFNELLLANLLAPPGVATLSPNISQQEYFRLFERDGLGLASTTDLRSDGQYHEFASQYGAFGQFSYSLDVDWQRNEGVRYNNELSRLEWYSQFKYHLTPKDSVFVLTKYQDYHSGDNFQYYDPQTSLRPNFDFTEYQDPIVLGAYHREWSPGVHTLALGGRLVNDQRLSDQAVPVLVFLRDPAGQTTAVQSSDFDVAYRGEQETWLGELNQIFQSDRNTLVLGGRFQGGEFDTGNVLTNATQFSAFFPPVNRSVTEDFQRWTAYAYDTWELAREQVWLTAGLAYDQVDYPENLRQVPVSPGQAHADRWGPKAALVWSPAPWVTWRTAYARSLGGVSLDESYRLEPAQLAGFNQSFRTLIPESVAGSVAAPKFDVLGSAFDFKFPTRTYVGLAGDWLHSDVSRALGIYGYPDAAGLAYADWTPQQLRYDEYSAGAMVNQLLSHEWSAGVGYKFTRSELKRTLEDIPVGVFPGAVTAEQSDLHTVTFNLLYRHRCGFFGIAEVDWYFQNNVAATYQANGVWTEATLPGADFPQVNFWVGYRFPRSLGDMSVGLLNATGENYKLNPLNPYAEMPRERVFAARLRVRF